MQKIARAIAANASKTDPALAAAWLAMSPPCSVSHCRPFSIQPLTSSAVIVTGNGPFSRNSRIWSMPLLNWSARLCHWPATDVMTYVSRPAMNSSADRIASPVARPRGMILA